MIQHKLNVQKALQNAYLKLEDINKAINSFPFGIRGIFVNKYKPLVIAKDSVKTYILNLYEALEMLKTKK